MKPKTKELIKEFVKCGAVVTGCILFYDAAFVGCFATANFMSSKGEELREAIILALKIGTFVGALASPVAVVGTKENHKLFWKNRCKEPSPT